MGLPLGNGKAGGLRRVSEPGRWHPRPFLELGGGKDQPGQGLLPTFGSLAEPAPARRWGRFWAGATLWPRPVSGLGGGFALPMSRSRLLPLPCCLG